MKLFERCVSVLHPWTRVSLASWRKYPNDNSPHVLHVDYLSRTVDPETGVLRTERLLTCKQNLPSILEYFVGKDSVCYIREVSEVDPVNKTMTLKSRNLTFQHLMTVEETCIYSQHPEDSNITKFSQEAQITVSGVNVASVRAKIEDICIKNFEKNSEKGLQGLLQVVERIKHETVSLAEIALHSTTTMVPAEVSLSSSA